MRLLRIARQRLRSLFGRRNAETELERELAFHFEQLTRKNLAAGMCLREAQIEARRAMGNIALMAEQCRDQRRTGWLVDLQRDLAYAWRMAAKSPAFTGVAVLTPALGVGSSISVFTLGEALLLRSLPYPEPERLVFISSVHVQRGESGVGQEDFRDWQSSNSAFERMAFTEFSQMSLTGQGEPERITGRAVSQGFFELLGIDPKLGRWFRAEEQEPGADPVVMLSNGLWRRKLGGREDAIGGMLALDGRLYRIAGVMPESFRFNEGHVAEYWTPIRYRNHGRMQHQYSAYGRLKNGVTVESAQRQMSQIALSLEKAFPETNSGWGVRVQSLRSTLLSETGPALLIFSVAVIIVLLVACGNVASLLLARGIGRAKEIAIRVALGASRRRVVRLLLTESLVLSCLGTAAGLALVAWLVQIAIAAAPLWMALESLVSVNTPLLCFTILLTFFTALLTGAWPAVRGARNDVQQDLKESGNSLVAGGKQQRALNSLVVMEVALAIVLLTFAGLLVKSFAYLLGTDLGFRPDRLLTFRMPLLQSRYSNPSAHVQFYDKLLPQLAALPGVVSVAAADAIPLGGAYSSVDAEVEGQVNSADWADRSAGNRGVTPDSLRTMGAALRAGRGITVADREGTEPVVVVNETFVRKFLSHQDPLGKRIRLGSGKWQRIVGVVSDLRHNGPSDRLRPETYTPFAQDPWAQFVVMRTAGPEAQSINAVRAVIRSLDRDLPITQARTMNEAIIEATALPRALMALVSGFAAITMGMATLGLAGVMAYNVSRRKREIGLRMALGGSPAGISASVLRKAASLIAKGSAIGIAAGLAGTRLLESVLFGVRPRDPLVLILAPLLLAAAALMACLVPARRAAAVDPMSALRQE